VWFLLSVALAGDVPTHPEAIVLRNSSQTPWVLERSFGPASMLKITGAGLPQHTAFDDKDDARSSGFVQTCLCACGDGSEKVECPQCEEPMTVTVTIPPGGEHTVAWEGRLRAHMDQGTNCITRFSPEPGPYTVSACGTDARCAQAEVTLPSAAPLVLTLE